MPLTTLLKQVTKITNHGLVLLGPDQRIMLWNGWMVKASGVEPDSAEGKTLHELFGDRVAKRLQSTIDEAINGHHSSVLSSAFTPHPLPLRTGHKLQEAMIQRVTLQAIQFEAEYCCLIDIADVTNAARREKILKHKSNALSRALDQLKHILASVSGAVISTNMDDEIETLNPAAETLLDITQHLAKGQKLTAFIDLLPKIPEDGHFQAVLQTTFGSRDGKRRAGFLNISINSVAKTRTRTWFIQDVTKEKETEAKLREATHIAEEASRHKSQFLANMSHEIRTPMNGVLGMAELLLDSQDLSEEQLDFVSTIQRSANGMLHIINDLLDFSKLDSGRMLIKAEPFDLRAIVEDVCDLLDPQARRKGVELTYFMPHHIPGDLVADPIRIHQILMNLISNAIKFTDQGSIVMSIFLDPIANRMTRLRISVQDSGIGIPKESLPNIFEPFSQVDNSTTRRHGGTGLGLAICKQLCHYMDGSIEAASVLGEGSTFTFQIPVHVADRAYPVFPFSTEVLAPILVLTRSPKMRQFLSHQLKQWPQLPVTLMSDGNKALQHLQKVSHFGVIIDTGVETLTWLEKLRQIPSLRSLPALAVVGFQTFKKDDPNTRVSHHLLRLGEIYGFLTDNLNVNSLTQHSRKRALEPLPERCRVLLVEDNLINQKVARKMLDKLGCDVDLAENGALANKLYKTQVDPPYDVIFMDCMMPVLDGYEATRHIRNWERDQNSAHTTIVAMTANAMSYDREKCLAAGMDDYLSKPVKASELRQMILKWVDHMHL